MAFDIQWPDSGQLVRRIAIKPWSNVPAALSADLDAVYAQGISRWACRVPLRGGANWQGQQIEEEATDIWWVRYGAKVPGEPFDTKPESLGGEKVIEHAGRRFRILRAMNAGDAQRFTMILCKDLGDIA